MRAALHYPALLAIGGALLTVECYPIRGRAALSVLFVGLFLAQPRRAVAVRAVAGEAEVRDVRI